MNNNDKFINSLAFAFHFSIVKLFMLFNEKKSINVILKCTLNFFMDVLKNNFISYGF